MNTVTFPEVVSRGCGIDVHKKVVVATIDGSGLRKETREFDTFTRSLTKLKDWLLANEITHVAMESTGVYWKPVYNALESSGLVVWIVNARHIKYVRVIRQTKLIVLGSVNFYWQDFLSLVIFQLESSANFEI